MGIVNPLHLIFVGAIALIVLGPKRLPELARSLGHGMREFRDSISAGAETDNHDGASDEPVLTSSVEEQQLPSRLGTQALPQGRAPESHS
jgi:sec-independent protein translocase protein TatA